MKIKQKWLRLLIKIVLGKKVLARIEGKCETCEYFFKENNICFRFKASGQQVLIEVPNQDHNCLLHEKKQTESTK